MIRAFAIMAVLALASSLTAADELNLKKLSLDDASTVSPRIQTDSKVKVEGKGSVKITTRWPTTVCLGEVAGLDLQNAKLVYKAKVKSDLDGIAFLEIWAHVGEGQYFSKGVNDPIKKKADWKSIQTSFVFQKGQRPDKVTLNLVIQGKGTVWIDDIVLSKTALK